MVLAVLGLFALVLGIAGLAALDTGTDGEHDFGRALNDALFDDYYSADLTTGGGDFVARDFGAFGGRYEADGYHLFITEPGEWAPAAVRASLPHTVLGVEILTSPVTTADGAAFGPGCWKDIEHGYELLVAADGTRTLVAVTPDGLDELATAAGPPPEVGRVDRLLLTCVIRGIGSDTVELTGYVDGDRVIRATGRGNTDEFTSTGFAGHTGTGVPAEWRVTKFWRRGPDEIP